MTSFHFLVQVIALSFTVACSLAATAKPALILVPGAFHQPSVYDEVKAQFSGAGYERVDAVDLPSVDNDIADVERTADTSIVTELLETRLSNDEDVILVGNSYGATNSDHGSCEAVRRPQRGLSNQVDCFGRRYLRSDRSKYLLRLTLRVPAVES